MRYAPGTTAPLTVEVKRSNDELADADVITADIYDPYGIIVDNGVPEHVSLGTYRYDYVIPADAETGSYRIEWRVVLDGVAGYTDEFFDVEFADQVVDPGPTIDRLRMALSERIPVGKTEADTAFTNAELATILTMGNDVFERAAAIGWSIKGGDAVELIDISENGSDRKLSQIYDHCRRQFQFWDTIAESLEKALVAAGVHRVAGVASDIWSQEQLDNQVSLYADGKMDTMYIRAYPLKRFPAVL